MFSALRENRRLHHLNASEPPPSVTRLTPGKFIAADQLHSPQTFRAFPLRFSDLSHFTARRRKVAHSFGRPQSKRFADQSDCASRSFVDTQIDSLFLSSARFSFTGAAAEGESSRLVHQQSRPEPLRCKSFKTQTITETFAACFFPRFKPGPRVFNEHISPEDQTSSVQRLETNPSLQRFNLGKT